MSYIFTSQDFSWLQNGQLKTPSKGSSILRFGGGFRDFLLLPISEMSDTFYTQVYNSNQSIAVLITNHKSLKVTWLVITEVRSFYSGWLQSAIMTLACCAITHIHAYWMSPVCNTRHIFAHRVWYHVLSLHYVCIRRSSIILTPLGYLCAKFRFCCALHCWASPLRKIAYLITHSLTRRN